MTKPRIDFYTKVHKALRAGLFELSQCAAATDYADPHAVAGLRSALDTLLARLSAHAAHESRFIHPLLLAKTGSSIFDAEHGDLERQQDELARLLGEAGTADAQARRSSGLAFYRALNVFISRYLAHLAREEASMPELWQRCTEGELAEVMARFGSSRPLDEALADVGWMLPALSAPERAELIAGMSAALGRR